MPYTPIDAMAKITRIATFTSATCRRSGSFSSPSSVVSPPNGTTEKAANAAVAEMIGARAKRSASAARGRSSSLNINLMTSASGCSRPCQRTRVGPMRCCSAAARRRSTHTIPAAADNSATKTKTMSTSCATSSGVIGYRDHEGTKTRRRTTPALSKPFFVDLRALRAFVVPSPSVGSHRLGRAPGSKQGTAVLANVRLVFVAEMLQRRLHRGDRGVAEGAQRLAADVRRDAREQIEIAHLPLAVLDAAQDLVQPVGALAARRAFAARFVTVEMQQVL